MLTLTSRSKRTEIRDRFSEEDDVEHIVVDTPFSRFLKKASIFFYALFMVALIGWEALQIAAPNGSMGKPIVVPLKREPFTVLDFPPFHEHPKAIILFGTGDGGWSGFEEAVCRTMQAHGYEAVGIDFNKYARTDYSLAILQSDMDAIAHTMQCRQHDPAVIPVIMAGYSMGAAQAIAAAGGPHPPRNLIGLLAIDPLSRGRYGLRLTDQANILPYGNGTFGMEEFSKTMGTIHVIQWHAAEDSFDSRSWLKDLTAPHREFDFGQTGHFYNNDRDNFLNQLVDSIPWLNESDKTVVP